MAKTFPCPSCGAPSLDVTDYLSMMVLRSDVALFSVRCPLCGARVTSLQPIPASLREEVSFAAIELGAGMGKEQC